MPGRALSSAAFDPLDYPWTSDLTSCGDGFRAGRPVLAVGCNASPAMLRAKLARRGVDPRVAVAPYRAAGIAVGHSAHVSVRGYIPAAPYPAPGVTSGLHISWFDDEQLAALDATEPNYDRVPFGDVDLYVSRWGVLAVGGVPIPLTAQRDLHRLLAHAGAGGDVIDAADAAGTLARLQQADARDRLRTQWAEAGFAISSGLPAA